MKQPGPREGRGGRGEGEGEGREGRGGRKCTQGGRSEGQLRSLPQEIENRWGEMRCELEAVAWEPSDLSGTPQ